QLMNQANEGLPGPIIAYLRKANDSVNKLQHLIDDLLDVSKIQSGKLEFVRNRVDLSAIVKDSIENGVHMFPQFEFVQQVEDEIYVDGNADRLEQVIMNLLSNAVKYSAGTKKISVSLK